ncbi:MAG TPA: competence protein CoiA family protein [Fimbriimonas sp.]|nr:competence protein CoiA family protein [Fimbriimonas sp.]
MFYAVDGREIRIEAAPRRKGFCPLCREPLVARCGDVIRWHWAHQNREDCDRWWEPETDWHLAWKALAHPSQVEVVLGEHRADIVGHDDVIVELQNSAISAREIVERERFYDRMVWLLNGADFAHNFRVEIGAKGATFHWAHARPSWQFAKKPIFIHSFSLGRAVLTPFEKTGSTYPRWHELDRSQQIFQIKSVQLRPYVRGAGRIISVERFTERLISAGTLQAS